MEKLPKNLSEQRELLTHREHPHEDLSKIGEDFESVGKKFEGIFDVAREKTVADTLGRVDSTLGEISSAGLMDNFPGLENGAQKLHRQADDILSR